MDNRPGPHEIVEAINGLFAFASAPPSIGIGLDPSLDESPIFFMALTAAWRGKVFVLATHCKRSEAERLVESYRIRCDKLVIVRNAAQKEKEIVKHGILAYFDGSNDPLPKVSRYVAVLRVRSSSNFDYDAMTWR